jgi:hypothetical protein
MKGFEAFERSLKDFETVPQQAMLAQIFISAGSFESARATLDRLRSTKTGGSQTELIDARLHLAQHD